MQRKSKIDNFRRSYVRLVYKNFSKLAWWGKGTAFDTDSTSQSLLILSVSSVGIRLIYDVCKIVKQIQNHQKKRNTFEFDCCCHSADGCLRQAKPPRQMAIPSTEDPFLSVQREVQTNWDSISWEYEQWRVKTSSGALPNKASRELLENKLHTIEWDIQDLQEAVSAAKRDPARYQLKPAQISTRERFVQQMMRNIQSVQSALQASNEKAADTTTKYAGRREELFDGVVETARKEEMRQANDAFIDDQILEQERIVQEQDHDLGHLASAVERIGLMGHDMHQELAEQGQLLDELGDDMDNAQHRMANVRGKLDRFIAETGPRQFCTIVGLFITFLILTVLVATT